MIWWLLIQIKKVIFPVGSHIHVILTVAQLLQYQMGNIILECIVLEILSMDRNWLLIIVVWLNLAINIHILSVFAVLRNVGVIIYNLQIQELLVSLSIKIHAFYQEILWFYKHYSQLLNKIMIYVLNLI